MRVSVVICTYNRAVGLSETIACLRLQRYRDFEVVVVNGPSTDGTAEYLRSLGDEIKNVDNPAANLSSSRNIGIRASAGDIVAFIDDDALPEPTWLEQAVPWFGDEAVAGVGGIVLDHTGMALQYRYSAATRFGEATFSDVAPYDRLCVPGAATFPYLQGTNSLFRRSALAEIGLFDEVFDFYLDETDVCCRLVDAGYLLKQIADAPVHHKYLPSARRNEAKVVTNWYSIVRNFVYFGYRHALVSASEVDVYRKALEFVENVERDARYHEDMGVVPSGHVAEAVEACGKAISAGAALGRERADLRLEPAQLDGGEFVPFGTDQADDALRIVLVSSGYRPNLTGGISRFISDVAPELARLGHEVRVFTRSATTSTVDLEDGVWVHRLVPSGVPGLLPDAPTAIDGFATAVSEELERVAAWWAPHLAYGSLWDVELLGLARSHVDLVVVPMLATPVAEVAEHEGWTNPEHTAHGAFLRLIALERELLGRANAVHAISDAIVATFERLYPDAVQPGTVRVAHIGRADDRSGTADQPSTPPMVLFVGRLEARKGIDTFLDAVASLVANDEMLRVVVAGDGSRLGPGGETYEFAWRAAKHRGGERVEFVGAVDDDTLSRLIQESRVVVMPSRYESFGLVVVEAMMHSRAVVASNVGGIPEIVLPGVTGILSAVGDVRDLASAISSLVDDADLARTMGAAGRARFDAHLRSDMAARRLVDVLFGVVGDCAAANSGAAAQ